MALTLPRSHRPSSFALSELRHGADLPLRQRCPVRPATCGWRMAKPAAPGIRIRRWSAGEWTESPDMVVTEEPLQLMLEGEALSVVMRTPGNDLELSVALMFAEGILRAAKNVRVIRISAESGESERAVPVESALVESN